MQLHPVRSSRIQALGYDETTWTCYVQFQPTAREPGGSVYAYAHVPPEMFRRFLAAPSLGRFFGQHLADRAAHPYLRLGEPHPVTGQPLIPEQAGRSFDARRGPAPSAKRSRAAKVQPIGPPQRESHANAELSQLARERRRLIEFFRPMKEATLAAHQAVLAQEREALAQFANAEATLVRGLEHPREA